MSQTVAALFEDFRTAEDVVAELVNSGFSREDISLISREHTHGRQTDTETPLHADDASTGIAATGAGAGAVLGGIAGLLAGLGALAIPGIGPILAAGPLAGLLAGAGVGVVAGGIIGALGEAGVSEQDAHAYAEGIRHGGTLVAVRAPDDRVAEANQLMQRFHPVDAGGQMEQWRTESEDMNLESYSAVGTETGPMRPDIGHDDEMYHGQTMGGGEMAGEPALHASDLGQAQGGIHDRSHTDENAGEPALHAGDLGQAGYETEHQPATGRAGYQSRTMNAEGSGAQASDMGYSAASDMSMSGEVSGQDYEPEMHEGRELRDAEATRNMGDAGVANPSGAWTDEFSGFDSDFRNHHDLVYGERGQDYMEYEPAYRYGYDLAGMDANRDKKWTDLEAEARSNWEQTHSDRPWDDYRDAVRYGWERATSRFDQQRPFGTQAESDQNLPYTGGRADNPPQPGRWAERDNY